MVGDAMAAEVGTWTDRGDNRDFALTATTWPTTATTATLGPVATPPRPAGKVAFSSERDGNRQTYTMNADGSGQTRLIRARVRTSVASPAFRAQPATLEPTSGRFSGQV